MARINQPEIGQAFWTLVNGEICQRVYGGPVGDDGHLLRFVGSEPASGGYYESHLFAYEHKSDLLHIQLEAARRQAAEAAARVPLLELTWRNALKAEREAQYDVEDRAAIIP
ncbi:hypothetical protein [Aquipseudomonas alcaligenes]|uniref:Uncharacterized protein n=1 Tax=Aquipseudomonas alcaligenes TaxID=43263 RepID=A0A1N6X885_AQUAC|nr:hypothetical protein [Pseudomonas alcaligenes]SIQ98497.1 hypothetical protein SAMN05878282_11215 [Pseudomonas alcaligenes]